MQCKTMHVLKLLSEYISEQCTQGDYCLREQSVDTKNTWVYKYIFLFYKLLKFESVILKSMCHNNREM